MQKAIQEMVLNRLTSVQRIEVANDRIGDQDVVSMVLHSDMEKLRQTGEILDRDAFRASVNALLNAKRIYIVGVRSAAPLANFLGYYLGYMFNNVHIVTSSGSSEMFEKIVGITAEDAVIAFSFPRYSTATLRAAGYCRSVGATVVGVTDNRQSPLALASDYVLLATPLTDDTRGMIGAAQIAAMKPTSVLINVGRGAVVDEAALITALDDGKIRGAALDVFAVEPLPAGHRFYSMENVLLSPHTADHVQDFIHLAVEAFLANLKRFQAGQPLMNLVDKHAGY
jgi:DNA-binding MurR/RpiR family transcriptional regulator